VKDDSESGNYWITVKVRDELFSQVVYYYDKVKGKNVITRILFITDSGNAALLKAQLAEKYGDKFQREKGGQWILKNVLGHELTLRDAGAYSLARQ
jgi:hypothetical protein